MRPVIASPRHTFARLAMVGLTAACVLFSVRVDNHTQLERQPDAAQLKQLEAQRHKAIGGNRLDLKRYLLADTALYWPQFAGRIVVVQGDGEDATPRSEYDADFTAAYRAAVGADAVAPKAEMDAEYRQSQLANRNGTAITRTLEAGLAASPYVVISMPSGLCTTCERLEPAQSLRAQCKPYHPDLAYFETHNRMFVLFHEQAHALRHLTGTFDYRGEANRHREEVTANIYANMRMMQLFGAPAVRDLERRMEHEPVTSGSNRYYIDHKPKEQLLQWYRTRATELPAMHPHVLLQEAAALAAPHLLSGDKLVDISRFERQEPFLARGSAARAKLARQEKAADKSTHVHDENACHWYYPPAMREVDGAALKIQRKHAGATQRYYANNPLRTPGLANVSAFGFNPRNEAQVQGMVDFNNSQKPAHCPVYTAEDVQPKELARVQINLPPAKAMCPQ